MQLLRLLLLSGILLFMEVTKSIQVPSCIFDVNKVSSKLRQDNHTDRLHQSVHQTADIAWFTRIPSMNHQLQLIKGLETQTNSCILCGEILTNAGVCAASFVKYGSKFHAILYTQILFIIIIYLFLKNVNNEMNVHLKSKLVSILIVVSILISSTSSIDCISDYQCQNQVLNCTENVDCDINCNSSYSCDGAMINCPINGRCNMFCGGGEYACQNTIINALQSISLDLTCNNDGAYMCYSTNIECPLNGECDIICKGNEGCRYSTINSTSTMGHNLKVNVYSSWRGLSDSDIYCPINASCIITAQTDIVGQQSRYNVYKSNIYGGNATELILNVSGSHVFSETHIYCPSPLYKLKNNTTKHCIINVFNDTNSPVFDHTLQHLRLYAEGGLKHVLITNKDGIKTPYPLYSALFPRIYCDPLFSSVCWFGFINDRWQCVYGSETNICNIDNPNTMINSSSIFQCNDPYQCAYSGLQCKNETSYLIKCNGEGSCYFTQIICPTNAACDVVCYGENSCRYTDFYAQSSTALFIDSIGFLGYGKIYCPNSSNPSNICFINLNDPASQLLLSDIHSTFDQLVINGTLKSSSSPPRIYCKYPEDTTKNCRFLYINGKLQCIYDDQNSICNINSSNPIEQPISSNYTLISSGVELAHRYYKCAENGNCFITCSGYRACRFITVLCPVNGNCDFVLKKQNYVASQIFINASHTIGSLSITASGSNALMDADIICPATLPGNDNSRCIINVDGDISGPPLSSIAIYAAQSFKDVDINCNYNISIDECYDKSNSLPQMYCTPDYSESCEFTLLNEWKCINPSDSICNSYTHSPTLQPTSLVSQPTIDSANDTKCRFIFMDTTAAIKQEYEVKIQIVIMNNLNVNLTNAIEEMINSFTSSLRCLESDCIESIEVTAFINKDQDSSIVNSTIKVCNEQQQGYLFIAYNNATRLEKDILDVIGNVSIDIIVVKTQNEAQAKSEKKSNDEDYYLLWILIAVGIILILGCIVCILVMMRRYKTKNTESNDKEIPTNEVMELNKVQKEEKEMDSDEEMYVKMPDTKGIDIVDDENDEADDDIEEMFNPEHGKDSRTTQKKYESVGSDIGSV